MSPLLLLLLTFLPVTLTSTGSYVDSTSFGPGYPLSPSATAQLSADILHLLDLAPDLPRPTPAPHPRRTHSRHRQAPAPTAFMQDVYRELEGGWAEGSEFGRGLGIAVRSGATERRPSALQERYNVSAWLEESLHAADLIASVPQDESVEHNSWEDRLRRLVFRFDHLRRDARLTVLSAELRLYRSHFAFSAERMRLLLQRLRLRDGVFVPADQLVTDLPAGRTGWLEVNISTFVTEWVNHPEQNAGLYIRLLNDRGLELPPDLLGFETTPNRPFSPFVVASFREDPAEKARSRLRRSATLPAAAERLRRAKRSLWNKDRYAKRTCARRELRVAFKDLNWDEWVIAPQVYPAFYCGGDCPFPLHSNMNITNHSIVQTLLSLSNQQRRRRPVPRPCCVPVALQSMKMLYFDREKRVMLRTYNDMKVESCGCH